MTGANAAPGNGVLAGVLDTLCPMHAIVDATGHIRHAGPALCKLRPGLRLEGMRLLELLELRRPRAGGSMAALLGLAGQKLHFALRDHPRTELKGVLVALPGADGAPVGAVLNLSFGISIVDAVRDYALTGADFAATDLAVELLYLVEAKSAAMDELRRLNLRLEDARLEAEHQAFTDKLTGLRNRRALDPLLARLEQAERPFALMHVDLDRFKPINDGFGHAAGDRVLQAVAVRLTAGTRDRDTVIRLGGDEFLLVLPGMTSGAQLARLAERLIAAVEEPVAHDGLELQVSASAGACLSTDYTPPDTTRMMADADTALYAAKAAGRRRFVLYTSDLGRLGAPAADADTPPGTP